MAFDYKKKGYQTGIEALYEGFASGSEDVAKNRFKRNTELEKRKFDLEKMRAQQQFQQGQSAERQKNQLSLEELRNQNILARKSTQKKAEKIDPNEITAFMTGKFTPAMEQSFGKLPIEDQISVIKEMANRKGFRPSGEREVETGEKTGGILGFGKKPVKKQVPVYSSANQYQR